MFETYLQEVNPVLVKRMEEFQAQAARDEENAVSYFTKLGWRQRPELAAKL